MVHGLMIDGLMIDGLMIDGFDAPDEQPRSKSGSAHSVRCTVSTR
jgi:hypothetical protein